jgi:hypothetical protein
MENISKADLAFAPFAVSLCPLRSLSLRPNDAGFFKYRKGRKELQRAQR